MTKYFPTWINYEEAETVDKKNHAANASKSDNIIEPKQTQDAVTNDTSQVHNATLTLTEGAAFKKWISTGGVALTVFSIIIIAATQAIRIITDSWIAFWTDNKFDMGTENLFTSFLRIYLLAHKLTELYFPKNRSMGLRYSLFLWDCHFWACHSCKRWCILPLNPKGCNEAS